MGTCWSSAFERDHAQLLGRESVIDRASRRDWFHRRRNNVGPLYEQRLSESEGAMVLSTPSPSRQSRRTKIPKAVQELCDQATDRTEGFLEHEDLVKRYRTVSTVSSYHHWIICIVERLSDSKQFLIKKINKSKLPESEKYIQPCESNSRCKCPKCAPHIKNRMPIDLVLLLNHDNGLPQLVEYFEDKEHYYIVTKMHGISQKRWRHIHSWFGSNRYSHVYWGEYI